MKKPIKFYGMTVHFSKRQYIYIQVGVLALFAVCWVWAIFGNFNELLGGYGIPLLIACTVGEFFETYFTLRQFRED